MKSDNELRVVFVEESGILGGQVYSFRLNANNNKRFKLFHANDEHINILGTAEQLVDSKDFKSYIVRYHNRINSHVFSFNIPGLSIQTKT